MNKFVRAHKLVYYFLEDNYMDTKLLSFNFKCSSEIIEVVLFEILMKASLLLRVLV